MLLVRFLFLARELFPDLHALGTKVFGGAIQVFALLKQGLAVGISIADLPQVRSRERLTGGPWAPGSRCLMCSAPVARGHLDLRASTLDLN